MKKLLSIKYLTLWCFLLALGGFFALSLRPFGQSALHQLRLFAAGEPAGISAAEAGYADGLPGKTALVTLNGGFRRLLGERAVNQRYLLDNGQLTYVIPELDMTGIAANTVAFAEALEAEGIPFLYVNTPFKTDPADKQLPVGVQDYANENADRFLALLREKGVDTLDLRERERAEGLDHYSLFYPTDHHWTAETGFWAFTELVAALAERDASFAADGRILDPDKYEKSVYADRFLGSHGRRVGPWYAGLDDLTVIQPGYDTHTYAWFDDAGLLREGSFADTFLFPEMLEGDPFRVSRYDVYLGGEYSRFNTYNVSREEGFPVQSTPKKLLIIQDSFSLVLTPFLALAYDELETVDLRLLKGDMMWLVHDFSPDAVVVIYNPGALEDNNWEMFDFLAA